jgi:hypothetical protein
MKPVETAFEPVNGYISSITRNTINGWYEIEIGIPKGWVFDENKEIKCEIITELAEGKIIKISPKSDKTVIDDILLFIGVIVETNRKIAEKEKEFTNKMEEMKNVLEQEAKKFYTELDALKENSFKNLNANYEKSLGDEESEEKKRHRRTKAEMELAKKEAGLISTSGDTETTIPPTVN